MATMADCPVQFDMLVYINHEKRADHKVSPFPKSNAAYILAENTTPQVRGLLTCGLGPAANNFTTLSLTFFR